MSAMGKADMCSAKRHVRFTPESDIKCDIIECPLRAKSGHRPTGLQMDSFSFLGVGFRDGLIGCTLLQASQYLRPESGNLESA
jgi:hypothetical protein